jgi:hypothetical protein
LKKKLLFKKKPIKIKKDKNGKNVKIEINFFLHSYNDSKLASFKKKENKRIHR